MNNKKKTTGILLSILGIISLILITAGVTYAFFTYAKEGETVNTITTGTIVFNYDEIDKQGQGINITDALPMNDADGMALTGTGKIFNFQITSKVAGNINVPYEVTVRKTASSNLPGSAVKIYLEPKATDTSKNDSNESNKTLVSGKVTTFADLTATDKVSNLGTNIEEKTIFTGVVPAGDNNYTRNFILRMWISGDTTTGTSTSAIDYSPYEFVKKTAATGTTALSADTLISSGNLITSTAYYALDDEARANYERIAYVNMTNRTIYTVGQVTAANGTLNTAPEGFTASEQFYAINGQSFKVTVNVYASATVVTTSGSH